MAIFRFEIKRSKNISHLDYINREEKYASKNDFVYSSSENVPNQFDDIKDFWSSAVKYERQNANIFKKITLSLPREFSNEKNIEISKKFLEQSFKNEYVYNYAIHNPNNENPHIHIMFSERKLDGIERDKDKFFKRYNSKNPSLGGTLKDRKFHKKEFLIDWRDKWSMHLNKYLMEAGLETVSSETLEKQKKKAIESGDYIKAELLNREPLKKYYESQKDKKQLYNNVKNMMNEVKTKLKKELHNHEYSKIYEQMKWKSFKEVLDEKEKIETSIFKISKKLKDENLKNAVYSFLSKGEIGKIQNKKRSLYKELKQTKDTNSRKEIKSKLKELDEEITKIKAQIPRDKLDKEIHKMKTKYGNSLKKLTNKKTYIDKIFMEKLKTIDKNSDDKFYYMHYIERKNLRDEREKITHKINYNKKSINENVKTKNYDRVRNLKVINSHLRKNKLNIDRTIKSIFRTMELNETISNQREFFLDEIDDDELEYVSSGISYER